MARAYDDDLRRKYLQAYDRGEGSLEELALRFGVSRGWGWKVSAARQRSGQAERVVGHQGRPSRVTLEVRSQIQGWFAVQPDLTLVQLQQQLRRQARIQLSIGRLWQLLRQMGLRLKKSRSTPPSGTRKRTKSGAGSSWKKSARPRRNT